MGRSKDDRTVKEEQFLTLLQRIQRQYNVITSSGSQADRVQNVTFMPRPPDEAAYALGKGLALNYLSLSLSVDGDSIDRDNKAGENSIQYDGTIPKGIQEKTLLVLSNRQLNPSICTGFFDALLQQCKERKDPIKFINIDVWLPSWILYTEQALLSVKTDNSGYDSEDEDALGILFSSLDPLSCMIRAYAHYIQLRSLYDMTGYKIKSTNSSTQMKVEPMNPSRERTDYKEGLRPQYDPRSLAHPSSYIGTVGKTYAKLQTQAGRLAMLREFTKYAFDRRRQKQYLQHHQFVPIYKLILTPLMACSVLSSSCPSTSVDSSSMMTESILYMENIWRETYSLVFDEIDSSNFDYDEMDVNDNTSSASQTQQDFIMKSNAINNITTAKPSTSDVVEIILWLTEMLDLFLLTVPTRKSHTRIACKELSHRWLAMVLDLGSFISHSLSASSGVERHDNTKEAKGEGKQEKEEGLEIELSQESLQKVTMIESNKNVLEWQRLADWFEGIISKTLLRWFALIPSYRISMENFWAPLQNLTVTFAMVKPLRAEAVLNLATMAMSHPVMEDVCEILTLFSKSIEQLPIEYEIAHRKPIDSTAVAMLRCCCSIFLRDPLCASTTKHLLQSLGSATSANVQKLEGEGTKPTSGETTLIKMSPNSYTVLESLIQLFEKDLEVSGDLIRFLSSQDNQVVDARLFSSIKQAGLLIFGMGLLNNVRHRTLVYAFLKKILDIYPHLGISLLPVMVDSINTAAIRGDWKYMMEQIDFLCECIVKDAQCAREVWNLVGIELMKPSIPAAIRSSIIRFFPQICLANKRLYKRVIESLGNTLHLVDSTSKIGYGHEDLEICIALIATIADLAREDQIRDLTDVIGWIQGFIADAGWVRSSSTSDARDAPGRAALVHYAILCLHFLVIAEELDYKLVIKVLSKRLCNVHDPREVSKLPPLVLESLILLLGDGETDQSEDENKQKAVDVSPHVSKSVETLVNLWDSESLQTTQNTSLSMTNFTISRCQSNIFRSFLKYSFEALGIDEEAVHMVIDASAGNEDRSPSLPSAVRYSALKKIVEGGITVVDTSAFLQGRQVDREESDLSQSFVDFVTKLLRYEEGILGSTLWQKRRNPKKRGPKKQYGRGPELSLDSGMFRSLPSSESVLKAYKENRCQATATAALLCFEGKPMSLLRELANDAVTDSSDPLAQTFYIQSWLNATTNVLRELVSTMSTSELLDKILLDVQGWRLDNPDSMYMCLSCIAMLLPDILGPYGDHSSYIKDISDDVLEAYNSHVFEDSDVARICYAFVAVCDISRGSTQRLLEIVSALEKTVTGYGSHPSFGAFFALAVIAQACSSLFNETENKPQHRPDFGLISRIVGFFIEQLSRCITGSHDALVSLVKCIDSGEITPDVIEELTAMKKKSLKIATSKKVAAESIFISLAICLPALTKINDELLLGIYCLLESLEWGCGKGFCLPSVLQSCRQTGLFEEEEIEKMYAKYAKMFEQGMENGIDGLDDIFYAVTAIHSKPIPYSIQKFMVGNRKMFDDSGRALSILSVIVSISSLPCLGRGADFFTAQPRFGQEITDNDIKGVVEAVHEGINSTESNKYSDIATILLGFLASIEKPKENDYEESTVIADTFKKTAHEQSDLPVALQGTVLEILMATIQKNLKSYNSAAEEHTNYKTSKLLLCLEKLSLPGQFAYFLENTMSSGNDEVKLSCVRLMVAQLQGRPRAIFDGHEFANMALKIAKMPVSSLRKLIGEEQAAKIFVDSIGIMLAKFPSQAVEGAVDGIYRFCISPISQNCSLILKFLQSMVDLLRRSNDIKADKSFRFPPKGINTIQHFLLRRVFAGIRDASWHSSKVSAKEQRFIVETYAECLAEIPPDLLMDADFFTVKELDGFLGESFRVMVVMTLVQRDYFDSPSRAFREIASSLAWICKRLIACDEEIDSSTMLQVACTIAQASEKQEAPKRKDLLLSLLDNLLMVDSIASYVGLEMVASLVFQWCHAGGSDGDLSLLYGLGISIDKWQDLPPETLKDIFQLCVHDMPFNLARYTRREKISGVVFNRLWRIYIKWWEQGAGEETLIHVRRALICCRDAEITSTEDWVTLATSMILGDDVRPGM